jgi:hypothetical protein
MKKILFCMFLLGTLLISFNTLAQSEIKRSPDNRKDFVNVFYNSAYTLFDFWSDEPIFPNSDGIYTIFTATNEDKTPRILTGNSSVLMSSISYKFKNYNNCKNWCEGKVYNPDLIRNQNNPERKVPSENITTDNMNVFSKGNSITIKQFSEALNLYYKTYKGGMEINSDVFDPMKLLIERGCSFFILKGELLSQYRILAGFTSGGPSSYGKDKDWRILVGDLGNNPKYRIDYDTVMSRFKNSVNGQIAPECKECKMIVKKYYNSYMKKTDLQFSEFNILKEKVQKCKNQRFDELSKKIKSKLTLLSEGAGGTSSYGNDKDWKLIDRVGARIQISYVEKRTLPNDCKIVQLKDKYGLVDEKGFLFVEAIYDYIDFDYFNFINETVYRVKFEDKYGLVNSNGDFILNKSYERILNISQKDSMLFVKKDGEWGYLKHPFKDFTKIDADNIYNNGLKIIVKGGKKGILNNNGIIAVNPIYDDLYLEYNSSLSTEKCLINVKLGSKYGLLDEKFKLVLPIEYDQIGCFNPTDKCGTDEKIMYKPNYIPIFISNKMGYFDAEEKHIKVEPIYDDIKGLGIYNIGLEVVSIGKIDKKYGLISNNTGKPLTNFKYDEIQPFNFDKLSAIVKINKKFGVVSIEGRELVNCSYDSISDYTLPDISILYRSGKLGIVNWLNKNYPSILEPKFNALSILDSKFILTRIDNKYGLVNFEGREIISANLDEIQKSNDGGYSIKLNNKWGHLNSEGVLIVSPMFDYQFTYKDNLASVSLNGLSYQIDASGNRFTPYMTIGDLDIYYKDISVANYHGALSTCQALGDGWRLPTSEELDIIYNNIKIIKNLTTEFNSYNTTRGYDVTQVVDAAVYWGENAKALCLRESAIGYGQIRDVSTTYGKNTFFYSVRPVRKNPEMEKQRKDAEDAWARYILSQIDFNKLFSGGYSSSNSSSSSSNSAQSKIYQKPSGRIDYVEVGKYENGKIYQKPSGRIDYVEIGKYENGKIYQKPSGRIDYVEVGKSDTYQGGAAFLLLFY